MKSNRLVMMVTAPEPLKIKSRLVAQMGGARAVEVYSEIVRTLCAELSGAGDWTFSLSVVPERARHHELFDDYSSGAAGPGDRGRKLAHLFLNTAPGPLIVLNSQCPSVTKDDIRAGFNALATNDVVFGPTTQGGFWGVGMSREPVPLDPFRKVDWKKDDVLQPTLKNLRADRKVKMLRELTDITTEREWKAYKESLGAKA